MAQAAWFPLGSEAPWDVGSVGSHLPTSVP